MHLPVNKPCIIDVMSKDVIHDFCIPNMRVAQEDVPMPYNERLEKAVLPSAEKLIAAVKKVCYA